MGIDKLTISMDDHGLCIADIQGNRVAIIRAMVELMIADESFKEIMFLANEIYNQTMLAKEDGHIHEV